MKQQGTYIGAEGKLAGYDIQYTINQKRPLIVFCHGFNGFKDWGAFNLMADYFWEGVSICKIKFLSQRNVSGTSFGLCRFGSVWY